MKMSLRLSITLFSSCYFLITQAQEKVISGTILDKQSDDPVPFASVLFSNKPTGTLTDSAGHFLLTTRNWQVDDSLLVSSVGYKSLKIPMSSLKYTDSITIFLESEPPVLTTVVKAKYNRALWFWKKIISKKPINDRRNLVNFGYEVYNKLELDLNNININALEQSKLLKHYSFILAYSDTISEKTPYLPVYLTETLSDYYFQANPRKTREIIKANNTNGIDNETIIKQIGATYQNINVYDNSLPVFDKQFVSPFSDHADNFYNFKLADTQYLNGKRLIHFLFIPKRQGENTFSGDCWVHDTSFAIQKITLRPSGEANINFVSGLSMIQEYRLINDSIWFLYKDKFVADLSPLGKNKAGVKVRKTATYFNVKINSVDVSDSLAVNRSNEDIILLSNASNKADSFWLANRHEPLNKDEKAVYAILDTLTRDRKFIRTRNALNFLTTGTKDVGQFRIGPWYNWISGNVYEGTRLRFDLSTNRKFSDKLNLSGYVAYGFSDQAWKGRVQVKYLFNREPWTMLTAYHKSDLDNGQVYYDQLGSDNIFGLVFRKPNIPFKFQRVTEQRIDFLKESFSGLAFGMSVSHKKYVALLNLPTADLFPSKEGNPFENFETAFRLRYAYQERRIEDNFLRSSLGSQFPIADWRMAIGWPGVMQSNYRYTKIDIALSDFLPTASYGTFYYNLFAGRVWGNIPYQLLDIQPGNEWYYFSRYSFNLMNRFEYLTDRYAGFNIEHHLGSGIFKWFGITRRWKLRQQWHIKGVVGDLSEENTQLNFVGNFPFTSLSNKLYLEAGTGLNNIFKFFTIDFVWRLLPSPLPENSVQKFGVFTGFKLSL
jgi:hypothetical protein